ncbi:alkaline phosphatase family protein [Salinactinospora qingdaonensis]|uniref:Alkaline phosphatase family protein n=1 Tax=Salinactinospora qingdaonensis TaxID=702744 RepID=A0ABP7ES53_9ACTN
MSTDVTDFEQPRYGSASVADLAPSALAALGVPGEPNTLALPPARHICVLLVDGMGWELLHANRDRAPFLASLIDTGGPEQAITTGFPTTTATSLTSLGTGLAPGHHGILGYQVAVPGADRIMNSLRWDHDIDPEQWQPHSTVYQRAQAAGVSTAYVAAAAFEGSGFSRASARGSRYLAANGATELVVQAETALRSPTPSYVFVYHSDLDTYGHMFGADSAHWRHHLGHVDRLAEQLAAILPAGGALYITADHGMVDTTPASRIDVGSEPALADGVRLLGGEARVRHVYTEPGAAADVLAAWRERLGERAVVLSREQAIDEGWFGAVAAEFLPRLGDVLALARGDTALIAPHQEEVESQLVGHHGSLTSQELRVPLLRATSES